MGEILPNMFLERRIPVCFMPQALIPSMPYQIAALPLQGMTVALSTASPAAPFSDKSTQHRSERTDTGKKTHSRT